MFDRSVRYEIRWDNGDVDSFSCFRWGTSDKCAEAARVLVNHCGLRCVGSINFPGHPPRPNQRYFDKGYAQGIAERKAG